MEQLYEVSYKMSGVKCTQLFYGTIEFVQARVKKLEHRKGIDVGTVEVRPNLG